MDEIEKEKIKIEKLKFFYEFQIKLFDHSLAFMLRAYTFFLAIMAGLTGLIFSRTNISSSEKQSLKIFAICLSILASICGFSFAKLTTVNVNQLHKTVKEMDNDIHESLLINSYFRKGLIFTTISMICGVLSVCAFLVILFWV